MRSRQEGKENNALCQKDHSDSKVVKKVNFDSMKELVEGYPEGYRECTIETLQQGIIGYKNKFNLKNC